MLAIALPVGLAVGIALGALGGGGSILAVPALVYLLGQDPRGATTSSLLIVGVSALVGVLPHLRAGRVQIGSGLAFGLLGVAGATAGSRLSFLVAADVLLIAFAALMLAVAALMILRRRSQESPGDDSPATHRTPILTVSPLRCACGRMAVLLLLATGVGLLTGFFGVGGGFAVVPALVLALGLPMPVAVGTSLLAIAVNSVAALLARTGSASTIDWGVVALFSAAAVAGSLLGARITARVHPDRLRLAFSALLVAVALYTGASTLPGLLAG